MSEANDHEAKQWLLILFFTVVLSYTGCLLLGALVMSFTPLRPIDPAVAGLFYVDSRYFYEGQGAKNAAFKTAYLSFPFLLVLSHRIARFILKKLEGTDLTLWMKAAVAFSWLIFVWDLSPLVIRPHLSLLELPPDWLIAAPRATLFENFFVKDTSLYWFRPFLILGVASVFFLPNWRRSSYGNLNEALLILLGALLLVIPTGIYAPSEIDNDWRFTNHLNALNDPLSQVVQGHHYLVDFPHQYGGYVEFVGGLLALLPKKVESLLLVFPLLHTLSVLFLLGTARLLIRFPLMLLWTGCALLSTQYFMSTEDHYYQYSAVRMLFPCTGLFAAACYLIHRDRKSYALSTGLAALASVWNLDTGIVFWISWTLLLMAQSFRDATLRICLGHLIRQGMALIFVWSVFFLYLRGVSGSWPDFNLLFGFQKLTLELGFFCLPLQFPDVWILVLMVYVAGFAVWMMRARQHTGTWRSDFLLLLSLHGAGIFGYFTGRSIETNLLPVSYPAMLIMGLFLSEIWYLMRSGKLPSQTSALVVPWTLMLSWWSCFFILGLPDLAAHSGEKLQKWIQPSDTPFEKDVQFIRGAVRPGENIYILSRHSGFFYFVTKTARLERGPGISELFMKKDVDALVTALDEEKVAKLVVDQNFYSQDAISPDVFVMLQKSIGSHYKVSGTSPSGQVRIYLPNSQN